MRTFALVLVICLAVSLGGCGPRDEPPEPPVPVTPVEPVTAPPPAPQPPPTITVSATPSGAIVTIDGRDCGPSPVSVVVQPGRHHVRVIMEGYATWETTVVTTSGEHRQVNADLQALLVPGVRDVTINSRPSGARIYVNGRFCGETPLAVDVDPASRIVAVADGYLPRQISLPETQGSVTVDLTAAGLPGPRELYAAIGIDPLTVTPRRYGLSIGPSENPNLSHTVSPGGRYLVYDHPGVASDSSVAMPSTLVRLDLMTEESVGLAAYLHGRVKEGSPDDYAFGPRFLAWTSTTELVVLAYAYRDDSGRPDDLGLAIDRIVVTTGEVERLAWLPAVTDGLTCGRCWTAAAGSIVYLALYEQTGSIVRVNLDTGRTDTIKTGIPLDQYGGGPIVTPSPDGTRVLIGEPLFGIPYVVIDLLTGREYPITPAGDVFGRAIWSPDGTRVAFPHCPPDRRRVLPTEEMDLTMSDGVMIVSATGQSADRIELPVGLVHTLSWLGDSRGLLIQAVADVPDVDSDGGWKFESRGLFQYRPDRGLAVMDVELSGIAVDIQTVGPAAVFTVWDGEQTRWWLLADGELSEVPGQPVVSEGRLYAVDPDGRLVVVGTGGLETVAELPGARRDIRVWSRWLVAMGRNGPSEDSYDMYLHLIRME